MPFDFKTITEAGIGIFTVSAGTGLLIYLIKHLVVRLGKSVDKLVHHIEVFSANVTQEHKQSQEQHVNIMRQHEEIMKVLGRINGYKE